MPSETLRAAFPGRGKPAISYGIPFTEALTKHVDDIFDASHVFLLVSKSLATNTTHLQDVKTALGDKLAGIRVGMKPHTQWSEVLQIVSDAQSCNADLLVTLGAGSLTDAAKVISLAMSNNVTTKPGLEELLSHTTAGEQHPNKPAQVPVICIPTSLSGGEYSAFAGATNDETGRKWSFSAQTGIQCPQLIILDPELSASTPEHVWLSTGVKALDHCVETLCSLQSDGTADQAASDGLNKLIPGLLGCKKDGHDLKARLRCQLGVVDAMTAATRGIPLGASHGIGHQLGPVGVGHGETSCILLPAVCKYNYKKGANKYRQDPIVAYLWLMPEAVEVFVEQELNKDEADLGDLMDAIIRALGMPRSLQEFGIGNDKLSGIAEHSLEDRWVKTNPAPLDKEGVLEILRMVM